LDDNGTWSNGVGYDAGTARYKFEFAGFQHDMDGYQSYIQEVQNVVLGLAQNAPSYDLAINLVYWSSYAYEHIEAGTVQYFRFSGDPLYIFDKYYKIGAFSDASGDCDVESFVTYDSYTGKFTQSYSYAAFNQSAACIGALDPTNIGYNSEVTGDRFELIFDIRSLVTAFALNSDILGSGILSIAYDDNFPPGFTIGCLPSLATPGCGDDQYGFFLGIDPDLPGMSPVYCLYPVQRGMPDASYTFSYLCAMKIADQFVYPILNHFGISGVNGNNPYVGKPCDCTSADGNDPYCDIFDLMIGYLFYEPASADPILAFQYMLDMAYRYDNTVINAQAYYASFSAMRIGGTASKYPPALPTSMTQLQATQSIAALQNMTNRNATFSFCQGHCNVFTIRVYDTFDQKVDADFKQVFHGGCSDTLYKDGVAWGNAMLTPPLPLVMDYVECVNFLLTSVINAFGVASGTAAPISAAFVILMVFIMCQVWIYMSKKKAAKEAEGGDAAVEVVVQEAKVVDATEGPRLRRRTNTTSGGGEAGGGGGGGAGGDDNDTSTTRERAKSNITSRGEEARAAAAATSTNRKRAVSNLAYNMRLTLKNVASLSPLSTAQLDQLIELGKDMVIASGATVYSVGEASEMFYYIREVCILMTTHTRTKTHTDKLSLSLTFSLSYTHTQ